ncbi:MAG: hypothetical protein ACHP8A_08405 [Terriglobales bacterium]
MRLAEVKNNLGNGIYVAERHTGNPLDRFPMEVTTTIKRGKHSDKNDRGRDH